MKQRKKIQIGINPELHKTLMSIPHTIRGQFVCMALHEYMKTADGKHLLKQFAKHEPDEKKLVEEMEEATVSTNLGSILGEF